MTGRDFSGILTRGGTILGSSRQSFKTMRTPDENGLDKVAAMKQNYKRLDLDCLVILVEMERRKQLIAQRRRSELSFILPKNN